MNPLHAHNPRPRPAAIGACLLLVAGIALFAARPAEARVFLRWGAAARSTRAIEESGGRAAYTAIVMINGGSGTLTVFSFDRPLAETVAALSAVFAQRLQYGGGNMATGTIEQDGRSLHLTLLELGRGKQTILFKLEQSAREAKTSRSRDGIESPAGMPAFPSGRVLFTAADESGGFRMAVSGAAAQGEAVQSYFAQELQSKGWVPALPAAASDAMRTYLRGPELCIVQTQDDSATGQTHITVLQKKQRTVSNTP